MSFRTSWATKNKNWIFFPEMRLPRKSRNVANRSRGKSQTIIIWFLIGDSEIGGYNFLNITKISSKDDVWNLLTRISLEPRFEHFQFKSSKTIGIPLSERGSFTSSHMYPRCIFDPPNFPSKIQSFQRELFDHAFALIGKWIVGKKCSNSIKNASSNYLRFKRCILRTQYVN